MQVFLYRSFAIVDFSTIRKLIRFSDIRYTSHISDTNLRISAWSRFSHPLRCT